jgi:Putative transposase
VKLESPGWCCRVDAFRQRHERHAERRQFIEQQNQVARLVAFNGDHVTFQWKDYAHHDQRRTMTLHVMEFLRRFVQHILPRGFVRIRQSGFLANTCRAARVALARSLLGAVRTAVASAPTTTEAPTVDTWTCPRCGAPMTLGPILSALQLATITLGFDTS